MSKLQEDSVLVGIGVAAFLTFTIYYCLYYINMNLVGDITIYDRLFTGVSERFIATLSVFFNIIPFIIYMRTRKDNCLRGVGMVTVIEAIFLMIYFYVLNHSSIVEYLY